MKIPVSLSSVLALAGESRQHLTELRSGFRSRLAAFRRNRTASEQAALEEDFTLVLASWGIADADIPGIISALRLRLPVFAVPVLACLITAAWSQSPVAYISLACIVPPCLLGMSRRSGAFPFYVTVALRRCAAGCCSSASVRSGRGVSLLTLIMKGVASCFPEPY